MNRAFLFFFIAAVVFGFFTVDFSVFGGQTAFGWLCPSGWSACEGVGNFLRGVAS
jgi:hypothetical protein